MANKNLIVSVFLIFLIGCQKHSNDFPIKPESIGSLSEVVRKPFFYEGPVFDRHHSKLYFTGYAQKKEHLYEWKSEEMIPVVGGNGIGGTFIRNGYLYAVNCEDHELLRFPIEKIGLGVKEVLFKDDSFYQPNDLCVSSNGTVYFTDPDFKGKKNGCVYLWSPTLGCRKIVTQFGTPNGIILNKKEDRLFVSDSHKKEWWVYDVLSDGNVSNGRLFFKTNSDNKNSADGMTLDVHDNLYLTGQGGVWIISPLAEVLSFIPIPEFCSNVAFGGKNHKTLYVTCKDVVYQIEMNVAGRY